MATEIRLTELVSRGGCACKIEAGRLDQLLRGPTGTDMRRLGDAHHFSTGGVRMAGSVDFGTPVVDDPGSWGEIAAANALSDVYAVGGTPVFALAVLGWPDRLPLDAPTAALEAAAAMFRSEAVVLGGGHSVGSAEPLLGFAVIGTVPFQPMSVASFEPGDELWLTKPLGSGLLLGAARLGVLLTSDQLAAALTSARTLNRDASAAAVRARVHAGTDVSGYGLLGACRDVAVHSGVTLKLERARVPWLSGIDETVRGQAISSRADETWRWLDRQLLINGLRDTRFEVLASAPETSGGLLLGLPAEAAVEFSRDMATAGHDCVRIGSVDDGPPALLLV